VTTPSPNSRTSIGWASQLILRSQIHLSKNKAIALNQISKNAIANSSPTKSDRIHQKSKTAIANSPPHNNAIAPTKHQKLRSQIPSHKTKRSHQSNIKNCDLKFISSQPSDRTQSNINKLRSQIHLPQKVIALNQISKN
jgi:hypothetical protein